MASSRKVKTFGRVSDTEEVPSSKSIGEAQLSETPYKHVVRHAVIEYPPSLSPRRACGLSLTLKKLHKQRASARLNCQKHRIST
ncbi:MAG: hypothetical protein MR030_06030 [Bacteroidales bacterium]|nr:hypothetical protein [Bacteroidales bacterium]